MIDWERFKTLRDEVGAEDLDEIVELFLEEVDSVVAALRDRHDLGRALHFLKGSALNLGFAQFSELCQLGETAAEDGKADIIDVEEIMQTYDTSKSIFFAELPKMRAA